MEPIIRTLDSFPSPPVAIPSFPLHRSSPPGEPQVAGEGTKTGVMAPGEGESPGGPVQNAPDRAQLKKAAAEFESFFIYYMLKSMRQAIPKGGLLDSRHRDTYTGLFDQEVASLAARRGGFGLGKAIENQFFPSKPVRPSSFPTDPPIEGTVKEGP